MSACDTPRRPEGEGEGAAKRCPPQVALAGIRVVTYLVQNASLSLSPATASAEGRQFNGAPSPGSTQRICCALEEPYATTVRLHRSGTYGEAHGDTAARGRLHGGGP